MSELGVFVVCAVVVNVAVAVLSLWHFLQPLEVFAPQAGDVVPWQLLDEQVPGFRFAL
jgi:hypothetical protein